MVILVHEIGHLFGLDHSSNSNSVMSPIFNFNDLQILDEDIRNLRLILGLELSEIINKSFNKFLAKTFHTVYGLCLAAG